MNVAIFVYIGLVTSRCHVACHPRPACLTAYLFHLPQTGPPRRGLLQVRETFMRKTFLRVRFVR